MLPEFLSLKFQFRYLITFSADNLSAIYLFYVSFAGLGIGLGLNKAGHGLGLGLGTDGLRLSPASTSHHPSLNVLRWRLVFAPQVWWLETSVSDSWPAQQCVRSYPPTTYHGSMSCLVICLWHGDYSHASSELGQQTHANQ